MLRGIYTGASGMTAMQVKMDTVANNLANVDKTAFKEDVTIFKGNPEVLIHRTRDDGVGWVPMGGFDVSPLVGKLGTGSEVNEIFTRFDQGALKRTERDQDVAINGDGFFVVQSQAGPRLTRSGSFILDRNGMLVTPDGFPLMGEKGPIQVNHNNYIIKTNGEVWINQTVGNDPKNFTSKDVNQWENPVLLDTLQIRTVDHPRHLDKVGQSFYNTTPESGDMRPVDQVKAPEILQGFLESSNVNIVTEMVNMIEVQRMYEANQRAITTHDGMLGTLINQVLRV